MALSNLIIRDYRQEDLPRVLELYDYALAQSPHFARYERLLEHLIGYSEAREGRIFVATDNEEITGWAIVSIEVGEWGLRFGNIAELEAKDVSSMNALVQACQAYSTGKNVDAIITVSPPRIPPNIVLNDWLPFETGVMMGRILSIYSLLQVLLRTHEKEMRKHFAGKRFEFRVDGEFVEIESTAEKVEIGESPHQPKRNSIELTMSPEVLLEVIFGGTNLLMSCFTGKVKVRGIRNIPSALKLLRMLRITNYVYVSNADRL